MFIIYLSEISSNIFIIRHHKLTGHGKLILFTYLMMNINNKILFNHNYFLLFFGFIQYGLNIRINFNLVKIIDLFNLK